MHFNRQDIANLESRRRASFVNSLSGFKSANLVGTADKDGNTNLAIMSSAVHLGSSPALLALVIRPGGEERHTLSNILATGQYSLNHVNTGIIESAHQSAARYERKVSEFAATKLTPHWLEGYQAPMVKEAHVKMMLELREHQTLNINATHLVIGEIVQVELPDGALADDGSVDMNVTETVALSGLDSYYQPQQIKKMAYAKPDRAPKNLLSE